MPKRNLITIILLCLSLCAVLIAEDKDNTSKEKGKDKKDELTLEKLFPEKSFFGPSARSMAFSFDGKYAAYLYRPYKERRHGSDLWIYDVAKGEARRITSVSVMARFQEETGVFATCASVEGEGGAFFLAALNVAGDAVAVFACDERPHIRGWIHAVSGA